MICKARLQQVGIFFSLNFLPWDFLSSKKFDIKKLRPPSIQLPKLVLVFWISNFFYYQKFPGEHIECGLPIVIQP